MGPQGTQSRVIVFHFTKYFVTGKDDYIMIVQHNVPVMKSRKSFFKLYELRPFITRRSNKHYLIDFLRNICGFYLVKYLARLLRNNAFNSILALLRPGEGVQQSFNSILALLRPGEGVQQSSNSITYYIKSQ